MMKFMLNLNVEKQINLLNNPHNFDCISNTIVCEDSAINIYHSPSVMCHI